MKTKALYNTLIATIMAIACTTISSCTNDEFTNTLAEEPMPANIEFTQDECRYLANIQNGNSVTPQKAVEQIIEKSSDRLTRGENDLQEAGIIHKDEVIKAENDTLLPDTLAYCFESKRMGHRYIVSADNRTEQSLLAEFDITNESEETSDKGQNIKDIIRKGIANYVRSEIISYEQHKDSILNNLQEKLNLINLEDAASSTDNITRNLPIEDDDNYMVFEYDLTDWHKVAYKKPMITIHWDQNSPYNKNLENRYNIENFDIGCVPIAVVQILSYWKNPLYVKGELVNWENLTRYNIVTETFPGLCEDAANLMEEIYDGCESTHDNIGGISSINKARNYFITIGFYADEVQPFSSNAVYNSIEESRPVFIKGEGSDDTKHAWNIDGLYKEAKTIRKEIQAYDARKKKWKTVVSKDYTIYNTMFHHNWGRGKKYDGWLTSGCFDYMQTIINIPTRSSVPTSLEYNIGIITNIYPNN